MENEQIVNEVNKNYDELVRLRRHLHLYPERAFKEFKTAEFIREYLTSLNIPYKVHINTGTSALIGHGDNCVALRADIDALPIAEETGLDFASKHEGFMHACGHDMHTAMVMVAGKILKENEDKLNGCVKLIFQPAEELIPGGARLMIDDGVLENPKPKAVFGQHIFPLADTGKILTVPGPMMASSDEMYWTIEGKGAHAAQPHTGNDPILAASNMVVDLQALMSRLKNPLKPSVLSITSIHGGSATNIIPDTVELMGTFRAFDNEWRMHAIDLIGKMSEHACAVYGVKAHFNPKLGFPPVVNDKNTAEFFKQTALEVIGENNFADAEPIMLAEDFAYYGENVPSVFWFNGCKNPDLKEMPPLHSARLCPDEKLMINGTIMLVAAAVRAL